MSDNVVNNDKQLFEGAKKRFQQICEYTFITGKPQLDEDGEDDENQPQQSPQQPQQNDVQPPMNGQEQQPPQQDMGEMPQDGGEMPMGGDEMPMDGQQETPMDGGEEMGMDDIEPMQDGDEVIDVDELTQSQKTSEYKLDGVDDKLTTLLDVTTKFITALKQNDEKIEQLKTEFEKRNPTDKEKLNIRSQASSPYNETPVSYWDKQTVNNPNYDVSFDNDNNEEEEGKEKEYVITKGDVASDDNKLVYNSFNSPLKLQDFLSF